jgi:hypothetical protein
LSRKNKAANSFSNMQWLFLNSSISEGLPLALGEAALTGAPIVCTDVGASLRVLTDPNTNERYSAVVAPNDPIALATAQINLLAMLGEWRSYADPDASTTVSCSAPSDSEDKGHGSGTAGLETRRSAKQSMTKLPERPSKKEVAIITQRMYDQTAARKRLGMRASKIVQKSFSGERYLREHEQMLWVGKAKKDTRHATYRETSRMNELVPALVDASVHAGSGVMDHTKVSVERTSSSGDISVVGKGTVSGVASGAATGCLPSLGLGTSAEAASVSTDSLSSISSGSMMGKHQLIKAPPPALINTKRLRRELRRLGEV